MDLVGLVARISSAALSVALVPSAAVCGLDLARTRTVAVDFAAGVVKGDLKVAWTQ